LDNRRFDKDKTREQLLKELNMLRALEDTMVCRSFEMFKIPALIPYRHRQ